jgi:hypothetical protein
LVSKEDWYTLGPVTFANNTASFVVTANRGDTKLSPSAKSTQGAVVENTVSYGAYKLTTSSKWEGMYLDYTFENGKKYRLEYDLEVSSEEGSQLLNIGCHNGSFNGDGKFSISVTDSSGANVSGEIKTSLPPEFETTNRSVYEFTTPITQGRYHIKVEGTKWNNTQDGTPTLYI